MKSLQILLLIVVAMSSTICTAAAQNLSDYPDSRSSDPALTLMMQGFPPPADKTVRVGDGSWRAFPYTRWSFSHARELLPSADVWRGDSKAAVLHEATRNLDAVPFTDMDGHARTWSEMMALTWTDGIIVLHQGNVVYERYFGGLTAQQQHIAMSMTKSFTGTMAAMLVLQGKIDPTALVPVYVPELKATAWADATVQQVMDMEVGIDYSESYADPNSGISGFLKAGGLLPVDANYQGPKTLYDFVLTLKKSGEHGKSFAYKSVNAQVLAWILKRVTGKSLQVLLSDMLWKKLGVEEDAYYLLDSVGTEQASGGLNLTLRDLARFGEMMRNGGRFNGQQIVPSAVAKDIERGGDSATFALGGYKTLQNWSYHNQWWISDWGAYCARGINGQALYIDPKAEIVIARFASHPVATNTANDPVSLPAYRAIAHHLQTAARP